MSKVKYIIKKKREIVFIVRPVKYQRKIGCLIFYALIEYLLL